MLGRGSAGLQPQEGRGAAKPRVGAAGREPRNQAGQSSRGQVLLKQHEIHTGEKFETNSAWEPPPREARAEGALRFLQVWAVWTGFSVDRVFCGQDFLWTGFSVDRVFYGQDFLCAGFSVWRVFCGQGFLQRHQSSILGLVSNVCHSEVTLAVCGVVIPSSTRTQKDAVGCL